MRITRKGEHMKRFRLISYAATALCALPLLAVSAQAATMTFTYSYSGTQTGPEVLTGTTLSAGHLLNGSFLFGNPGLDAALNPLTGMDDDLIDEVNGTLDGSVHFTFANGEMLFATQHVEGLFNITNTQVLTFTGGTGEFVGATGSASGIASLTSSGYMTAGSGSIDTSTVPEPASAELLSTGLAVLLIARRWTWANARRILQR